MNTPVYDPRIQKWLFPRQRLAPQAFRLFPVTKFPEEIIKEYPDPIPIELSHEKDLQREVKQVLGGSSTLPLINDLIQESQVIASSARIADPLLGQLLAFGVVKDKNGNYPVAGFASGAGRSDFCVSEMATETRTVDGLDGMELVIPRIAEPHTLPLHRFTTPIRQICFGGNPYQDDPVNLNPRVAVRAAGMTKIFKVIKTSHVPPGQKRNLVLRPLLTVLPNHAGGITEHADVAWNPYNDRQFGTIDQRGYWKLWDMEENYNPSYSNYGISGKLSVSGRVTNASDENGWGKIVWGAEPSTVFVCDRKSAVICDIRSNPATTKNISLPLDREKNLILDLQRALTSHGHHDAFVLTSTNITWVDTRYPGRPLMSVPHNRHKEDTSLHLDFLNTPSSMLAIIGSRLNPIISTFQFARSEDQTETPMQIGEPFLLASPSSVEANGPSSTTFLSCTVRKSENRGDEENIDTAMDDDENTPEASWFLGMSVSKNLGIERQIYSTKKGLVKFGTSTLLNSRGKPIKTKSKEVVSSDEEGDEGENRDPNKRTTFASRSQRIYADLKKHKIQKLLDEFPSQKRMDLPNIYKIAFLSNQDHLKTAQEEADDENSTSGTVAKITDELKKRAEHTTLGIASLAEIRLPERLFEDLSLFETKVHELLGSPEINDVYDLKSLLSTSVPPPHLAPTNPILDENNKIVPLSTLYNNLIESRLTPLPASVPPRVRLRRERLARQVATEYFLSSIGVSVKPKAEDLAAPPLPPSQLAASQDFPPLDVFKEPLKKIRGYANITPRINLLTDLRKVVDTWEIGQNPDEYVWDEEDTERVSRKKAKDRKKEKERRREERREERRRERLAGGSQPASGTETESRVPRGVQSQSAVVGLPGLPTLRRVVEAPLSSQMFGLGSSQALMSSQPFTMSQAVPGKFGGKTAAKKGKRKKGF